LAEQGVAGAFAVVAGGIEGGGLLPGGLRGGGVASLLLCLADPEIGARLVFGRARQDQVALEGDQRLVQVRVAVTGNPGPEKRLRDEFTAGIFISDPIPGLSCFFQFPVAFQDATSFHQVDRGVSISGHLLDKGEQGLRGNIIQAEEIPLSKGAPREEKTSIPGSCPMRIVWVVLDELLPDRE